MIQTTSFWLDSAQFLDESLSGSMRGGGRLRSGWNYGQPNLCCRCRFRNLYFQIYRLKSTKYRIKALNILFNGKIFDGILLRIYIFSWDCYFRWLLTTMYYFVWGLFTIRIQKLWCRNYGSLERIEMIFYRIFLSENKEKKNLTNLLKH